MFKWLIVSALIIIISLFIFLQPMEQKEIVFNNIKLTVEVAKSSADQAKGLSGREGLCDYCGMLFVYNDSATRHFWMNRMNFSLDFIWLANNRVVGISQNVPVLDSNGQTTRIASPEPSSAVLELKAGWAEANGLKIGDTFQELD